MLLSERQVCRVADYFRCCAIGDSCDEDCEMKVGFNLHHTVLDWQTYCGVDIEIALLTIAKGVIALYRVGYRQHKCEQLDASLVVDLYNLHFAPIRILYPHLAIGFNLSSVVRIVCAPQPLHN